MKFANIQWATLHFVPLSRVACVTRVVLICFYFVAPCEFLCAQETKPKHRDNMINFSFQMPSRKPRRLLMECKGDELGVNLGKVPSSRLNEFRYIKRTNGVILAIGSKFVAVDESHDPPHLRLDSDERGAVVFVEEKVEETPELKEKVQFPLSDYSDHYRFRDRGGEQRELFAQYSTAVNGKRMYVAVAETTSADITQVQDSENELVPIILHSSRKETFRVLVKAPK